MTVGTITHVVRHSGTDTGSLDQINTYDTFGNLINQAGSCPGNLGFQSKYFDQETGLYYFYHRYYSPTIGRFINEDPIGLGGGLNKYGFVGNDPLNWIDPFGFDKVRPRVRVSVYYWGFDRQRDILMRLSLNLDWAYKFDRKATNMINLKIDLCRFMKCFMGIAETEAISHKFTKLDPDLARRELVQIYPSRFRNRRRKPTSLPGANSKLLPTYRTINKSTHLIFRRIAWGLTIADIVICAYKSAKW